MSKRDLSSLAQVTWIRKRIQITCGSGRNTELTLEVRHTSQDARSGPGDKRKVVNCNTIVKGSCSHRLQYCRS